MALATLIHSFWGAFGLFPDAADGSLWTAPLTLPKDAQVVLNAGGTEGMRVELADPRFTLLPAFSGERAGGSAGTGGLACPVTWPGQSLAALADQTVRLRIRLARGNHPEPRLFAVYVRSEGI